MSDGVICPVCGYCYAYETEAAEFICWNGRCAKCELDSDEGL